VHFRALWQAKFNAAFSLKVAENYIYSYEMQKKMLPPELLLLAQICTKSFVGWGFAPDPTGGAYSAPPGPLAGLGVGPPDEGEEGGEGKGGEG